MSFEDGSNILKKHTISVVIPVANFTLHRNNITEIISMARSIEAEVILVLDCASSAENIKAQKIFVREGNDLQIISVDCSNPGGSRNAGKEKASGDWITFWDCDDQPEAGEVKNLIQEATELNLDVALGRFNFLNTDSKNNEISRKKSRRLLFADWQIIVGLNPGIWRFVFRKSRIEGIDFPDLLMGEDQVFLARFFSQDIGVHLSTRTIYNYRIGQGSQLTKNSEALKDKSIAVNILRSEFENDRANFSEFKLSLLLKMSLSICIDKAFQPMVRAKSFLLVLKCCILNPSAALKIIVRMINANLED